MSGGKGLHGLCEEQHESAPVLAPSYGYASLGSE